MKKKISLNLLIFLIVGLCFVFIISSCGSEETVLPQKNGKEDPQLVINKFSLTATNAGKIEWIFKANTAEVYDEKDLVEAIGIQIDFFVSPKSNKTISSRLSSERGNIDTKSNNMEAEGNVIVIAESGNKLFTEKVKWISSSQKFYTEERVRIEKKDSVLTGLGMEADPDLENIRILKEVKVESRE